MLGGIATTFIAWYYRDKIAGIGKKPRTREDTIFDGYERLLEKQQDDSDRKDKVIDKLEAVILGLHKKLDEAEEVIIKLRSDLRDERRENREIHTELIKLQKVYAKSDDTYSETA